MPLVLRLNTLPLETVDLRKPASGGRGEESLPLPESTVIQAPALASYSNSPLAASANGSALEAFVAFARNQNFQEVSW